MEDAVIFNSYFTKMLTGAMAVAVFSFGFMSGNVIAAEDEMQTVAVPDKYMFRIGIVDHVTKPWIISHGFLQVCSSFVNNFALGNLSYRYCRQ